MDNVVAYNILGLIAVTIPVVLLVTIGPEGDKRRLLYAITGLSIAGLIGGILYFLSVDTRFTYPDPWFGRLSRDLTVAVVEEIIRYPGILLAQYIGIKYLGASLTNDEEEVVKSSNYEKFVEGKFTNIIDPHGMGLFFGVGYGMGETIAFYMVPTVIELLEGRPEFILSVEITAIALRITAVMAHVALTYLAMAITSQRGFWRVTILLHLSSNFSNRVFTELAANELAIIVFTMFTRFAIVVVAYFLLRPRVRYLSPAVLVLVLVTLFLLVILISTFIALLVGFFSAELISPI